MSKALVSPLALMVWAVIASGLVLATVVIWTGASEVNIINRANVIVVPGLDEPLELVQGESFNYSCTVFNVDDEQQQYALNVTSSNPGVTVEVYAYDNCTPPCLLVTDVLVDAGRSFTWTVVVHVAANATGSASLNWVLTQV